MKIRERVDLMKLLKNLTVQTALAGVAAYLLSRWLFQGETPSAGAEQLLGFLLIAKGAFLTGLKMLIAPMIFFSLLQGINNTPKPQNWFSF